MNRLASYYLSENTDSFVGIANESVDWKQTIEADFPNRIFVPEFYEPRYAYPVVIWLHSQDSSEYELDSIIPHLSLRNYLGIGLRGIQSGDGEGLFRWSLSDHSVSLTEELIGRTCLSLPEHYSVRRDKIFLAGYGMGGSLAHLIAIRNPAYFAGAISINGRFPDKPNNLRHWKQARSVPLLWMHGKDSHHCDCQELANLLRSAHRAALQIYPAQFPTADELDTAMLSLANRFMMQIVTGEPIRVCDDVADSSRAKGFR